MPAAMSSPLPARPRSALGLVGWLLGVGLLALAWLLPANLQSLDPALLREAGRGTPGASRLARDLIALDKPGPAALVQDASRAIGDPEAPAVGKLLEDYQRRHRDLVPWGGWDPALEPLVVGPNATAAAESTPVLRFLAASAVRQNLRAYLAASRLPGVQVVLRTGTVEQTRRFVPAWRPGGQPLDAVILLTAYLWQREHLSPALQREVRALAESAAASGHLGDLEDFYLDILTLGKRLDWTQLAELLRTASSTGTVAQFAHLARVAPEHLPVIYTAALMNRSADGVARYLITFGRPGAENLRLALSFGEGAVRQLVVRQAPVAGSSSPGVDWAAAFVLRHPEVATLLKYAAFLGGVFLLLRAVDRRLLRPVGAGLRGAAPRMGSGVLAAALTFIFFVFSEPLLLRAAAAPDFQVRLVLPILGQAPSPTSSSAGATLPSMQTSTLLSILAFLLLQVGMYVVCLLKVAEIDRQAASPLLKLKLMENEENLFDGGLYIGIAGTATALVLQVLGLIEANLLAAYSSNLFGIVCVALVKIRHVRPYKRKLILESQVAG